MWPQSAVEVGKIITAARRHRGLTQTELARAVGATQSWVSEVEKGKDNGEIRKKIQNARYVGVRWKGAVVPWGEPQSPPSSRAGASLSDIIDAHTRPRRSGGG